MYGSVDIIGTKKLNIEELEGHFDKHQVKNPSVIFKPETKTVWAWLLMSPCKFDEPLRCVSKQGPRIWMQIVDPQFASTVWNIREKVMAVDENAVEKLEALAQEGQISKCKYRKTNFWRVNHKEEDIQEKFYFNASENGTIKKALMNALDFQYRYGEKHDFVSCLLVAELREYLDSEKLSRTGSCEVLRSRCLKHLLTQKDTPSNAAKANPSKPQEIAKAAKAPQEKGNVEEPVKEKPPEKQGEGKGGPRGEVSCKFFVPGSEKKLFDVIPEFLCTELYCTLLCSVGLAPSSLRM